MERNTAVKVLFVFNIVTMVAISLYLIYYLVLAFRREKPFTVREKIFIGFSFVEYSLTLAAIVTLALSPYQYGKWTLSVFFHGNMIVWVYMYMYTLQDGVEREKDDSVVNGLSDSQMNPIEGDKGSNYLDFESNVDPADSR